MSDDQQQLQQHLQQQPLQQPLQQQHQAAESLNASGSGSADTAVSEQPVGDLPTIASQLRKGLLSDEQAIDQLRILMTFADDDDLKRIPILIDDIRKAAAAEAANPAKALVKAAGISGLPMGGACSAAWRASRRAANATLHLTSPETAHTLKFDPSTGSQFADVPRGNIGARVQLPHVYCRVSG